MNQDFHFQDQLSDFFADYQRKIKALMLARDKYLLTFLKDPLARLLINCLRLSPLKSVLAAALITAATYSVGYIIHFTYNVEVAGITKTFWDFVYDIILVPLTVGFYTWISARSSYIFYQLDLSGIVIDADDYTHAVTEVSRNMLNNSLIFIFSCCAAVCMAALTIYNAARGSTVWGPREANYTIFFFIKVPVIWMIPWYMVCVIYLRELMLVVSIRRIIDANKLDVSKYHKDRCAKLKPITAHLRRFNYYLAACGAGFIFLVARSLHYGYFVNDVIVNSCLVVYVLISCFFFYFPLYRVNKSVASYEGKSFGESAWVWGRGLALEHALCTIACVVLIHAMR
jgi:hypothetical protein